MTATEGLAAMIGVALFIFGIADVWRLPANWTALLTRLAIVLGAILIGWSVAPLAYHVAVVGLMRYSAMTSGGGGGSSGGDSDVKTESTALGLWAENYDKSNGLRLFTGVVSVNNANADFKIVVNDSQWNSLSGNRQSAVVANAFNATLVIYCLQEDHQGRLVPSLIVRLIDRSGKTEHSQVTDPGAECH
jgi:hypothetical protein